MRNSGQARSGVLVFRGEIPIVAPSGLGNFGGGAGKGG